MNNRWMVAGALTATVVTRSLSMACQPAQTGSQPGQATSVDAPTAAPGVPLAAGQPKPNAFWWPERLNLDPLRQNARSTVQMGDFDYPAAFETLDLAAVKKDIAVVMTDSQDWWPADYGNYGPLFVRLAWHSAGTYRIADGRGGSDGGQQRFEPLNSWPDNGNLDKARRLLLPVKQKYGRNLSWADLMVLSGTVAMEEMGFETIGFAGGRIDDAEPELVYWGPEAEMLGDDRYHGERNLDQPLAAVQMGLIYVNPEGPNGEPDPLKAAADIRETFGRMAMNDEETVALIAGGHTFGKAHGAHAPDKCVDVAPAGAGVEHQGTGWHNKCGTGKGADAVTSGLEGAWTTTPTAWSGQYFANLFAFDWEKTKSPAGATQWEPAGGKGEGMVPDAHDASKRHAPIMFTTDLSLKEDPAYREVSERFNKDPEAFRLAFAKAWFKLTHRDMGPRSRYKGNLVPEEVFTWQDPVPAVDHPLVTPAQVTSLKGRVLASGLMVPELVRTAWASASSYRHSDRRGGANGARIRLAPQKDWDANNPAEAAKVIAKLDEIRAEFNGAAAGGAQISLADMIVLGGAAAVEKAAKDGGMAITVPFRPGRTDASAEQTDAASFDALEPKADGFRNYFTAGTASATGHALSPATALIDRADQLHLTVPEMTALIGGMRVLDANAGQVKHGVFTDRPGTLSNDFFVNLLDLTTTWSPGSNGVFEGKDPTGAARWTATEVDLVFGSNSELRAVAESYAFGQGDERFISDFIAAWNKVMELDRYDLG
ncbi:MAG: catalase/peroxidase HPI [Myxococcota bacterium]